MGGFNPLRAVLWSAGFTPVEAIKIATLNGANQTITATPSTAWSLSDARGTGAAWTCPTARSHPRADGANPQPG